MNEKEKLTALAEKVAACRACPLAEKRTNVVPGDGSPTAEVLFVGEGPGAEEDKTGKPFVGRAGKFLDEMLASIGWSRADIFIANVVKCRPPGNRDPEPTEVETCWPFLAKQIEIIQPKLIVTLGRHSMNRFLPGLRISKDHGRPVRRKDGQVFLPLYHPAAALYSPSSRKTHLADFAKIPLILKKISEI